ncbi:MAG: M81 family metallopeptidase [Verrucomicrobia bacterium]|nr:M81 family metallopeptidase [Verrucomicrobiota bacterium]
MKVLLAQFIFESNTFNPVPVERELFAARGTWLTGEPAVREWCRAADSQLAGSLAELEGVGVATHPVFVAGCGTPAGRLSADCFRAIGDTLIRELRAAGPADAILLHLHGAACAAGEDDVEGALLERVRRELGFTGRLVVSLDLHANVTRRMLHLSDAITAYRTMPHIDFHETGVRAARLVLRPAGPTVRVMAKVAALIPPTDTHHASGRFAAILAEARRLEGRPGIFDVSVFPVQPWLDVAEMGTSVVITAARDAGAAALAEGLARRWYDQRTEWQTGLRSWEDILAKLERRADGGPWLLVDSADATTAGAAGTSAEAIQRLWSRRETLPGEVLLWVVDPAALPALRSGAGARVGVQQVPIAGELVFSGEGRYRARGQAYTGQEFSMGEAVVVAAGRLRIVVSAAGALCADPAFYEGVGLAPDRAWAVQVKSLMGWRAGYAAPAERGLVFDGPGCASLEFARLPFTGERRELFPVNPSPAQPLSLWQST